MLRKDYGNRARIVQPTKKKRPGGSVLSHPQVPQKANSSIDLNKRNVKQYVPISVPQSDIETTPSVVVSVATTSFMNNDNLCFDYSPPILEMEPNDRIPAFYKRIQQCSKLCNFSNSNNNEKIMDKTKTLEDLLNTIKRSTIIESFNNEEYQAIFRMFLKHTNRTAPINLKIRLSLIEADQNILFAEDGWDHISLVYDIMMQILTDRKFNQRLCRASQLRKVSYAIISMFSSPDSREREKLSKLFHHYYVAMISQRSLIRKYASDFFTNVAQNEKSPIGISELLSAYIPIVSGFKVPLLQDHIDSFNNVILPLHKSQYLLRFHVQLVNLITTFVEKQRSLAVKAIAYILNIWPKTSTSKEINFMLELGHFVDIIGTELPPEIVIKLVKQVAICANSNSFNLCERTLMRWQSDCFAKTIASNPYETFKILLPALFRTIKIHWCDEIKKLAMSTIIAIKQSNPQVFDEIGQKIKSIEAERIPSETKRADHWKNIAIQADLPESVVSDIVTKLHNEIYSL